MTAVQTMLPSVFTVKQTVKEKQRKFKRKVKLMKKREEMSQTGTSVCCQAGTDSNLNERRKIKRLRYRIQHELHRLSNGVKAEILDRWYESEGIALCYPTIAIN